MPRKAFARRNRATRVTWRAKGRVRQRWSSLRMAKALHTDVAPAHGVKLEMKSLVDEPERTPGFETSKKRRKSVVGFVRQKNSTASSVMNIDANKNCLRMSSPARAGSHNDGCEDSLFSVRVPLSYSDRIVTPSHVRKG